MDQMERIVLAAYDRVIGLAPDDVVVDGCITKAPCGGEVAGRSPVDRGKLGLKRSSVVDANGIPLGAIAAPANRHDSPLLEPTLDTAHDFWREDTTVHLDRGYDSGLTRERLAARGLIGEIAVTAQAHAALVSASGGQTFPWVLYCVIRLRKVRSFSGLPRCVSRSESSRWVGTVSSRSSYISQYRVAACT